VVADREMVESEADRILAGADREDVAFLVVGDPFGCALQQCRAWRPADAAGHLGPAREATRTACLPECVVDEPGACDGGCTPATRAREPAHAALLAVHLARTELVTYNQQPRTMPITSIATLQCVELCRVVVTQHLCCGPHASWILEQATRQCCRAGRSNEQLDAA